ncbi:hypothetical protein D3C77_742440 [compost metagenome]
MLSVGQTDPEKGDGFVDWNVGIKKPLAGLDLALIYGSTDIDKADCGADRCENNVVFSASKSF